MLRIIVLVVAFTSFAYGEVGEVLSLRGGTDSYLMRNGSRTLIVEGTQLEVGDVVNAGNAYVTFILYPKIQMGLSLGSEIRITGHMVDEATGPAKTDSIIDLVKGLIRIQVTRDQNEEVQQRVNAKDVSFAVRGTEYEIYSTDEEAELDVFEGEVEVTSPHVQTLVPEIVKPREGFTYTRKSRNFARRAYRERLKQSRFLGKEELRSRWQKRKALRSQRKQERKNKRAADRAIRKEKKGRGR